MFERSEFGLRAASGEERRGPMRLHRIGSRPAKGPFGSFWVPPKGTRTRERAKALHLLELLRPSLCDFDLPYKNNGSNAEAKINDRASALSRGLLLSWQK
ncbi:hypothetical protein ACF3M1_11135 [Luteimonas sp. WGS1318]|uniref:hypothetical protein n=1 Tax=Luteimonas sp. WGS1318 TaxID=3366815 RepID=UPI00372D03E8